MLASKSYCLVEAVATGAGRACVRVVDGEALLLDGISEIDRCTGEVRHAHLVHDEAHTPDNVSLVTVELAVVEVQLVAQASAATWLNSNAKRKVVAAFLVEQSLRLCSRCFSKGHARGRGRCSHSFSLLSEYLHARCVLRSVALAYSHHTVIVYSVWERALIPHFRGRPCSLYSVKLPWQKSDEAPAAAAAAANRAETPETDAEPAKKYPKGYTPPKGRPTPKRLDQEIKRGVVRDPNATTPAQQYQKNKELKKSMSKEEWKAYKKQQREEAKKHNREVQAKMDAGDERYLMDRDRGETRRFVRDWVDSRRFMNNYAMPLAILLFLILFIGSWYPEIAGAIAILPMVFIVLILGEAFLIGKRANNAVRAKFPGTADTGFGLGMYAFSRASQPRKWRSPKPQVRIGETVN